MSIGQEFWFIATGVAVVLGIFYQQHVLDWRSERKKQRDSRRAEKRRTRQEQVEAKNKARNLQEIKAARNAVEDLTRKLDKLESERSESKENAEHNRD
jgi:hypothetical protein